MSTAALLAATAAGAGVLGAWECLATTEGGRLVDRFALALAPLARARREGREPSGAERRRLALLAAGSLLAGGWLLGGPLLAAVTALGGPAAVLGVVRARRGRYRDEVRRGASGAARALADAIGAGHSIRGALAETAPALPGAAGHELRITARALDLGEPTEAVLERLRLRAGCRAWDTLIAAILLQRDAGGDLPALLRELAAALEAADRLERRSHRHGAGPLHCLARRRPPGRRGGPGRARSTRVPRRARRRAHPGCPDALRAHAPSDRPRRHSPDRARAQRMTGRP